VIIKKYSHLFIALIVMLVLSLGFGFRLYAANHLNVDHDETTYLIAANNYTNYIRNGEYSWLAE
jgi:hypothetical protein